MDDKAYRELREIALNQLEANLSRRGMSRDELDDTEDLLANGVIDSFAFLDLVAAIEEKSGRTMDLTKLDPEAMGSLQNLILGFLSAPSDRT